MRKDNLAVVAKMHGVPRTALMGSDVTLVRAIQKARGIDPCFRSEKRLNCREKGCEYRADCQRLVAEWRR
jgi:hypothetical protein